MRNQHRVNSLYSNNCKKIRKGWYCENSNPNAEVICVIQLYLKQTKQTFPDIYNHTNVMNWEKKRQNPTDSTNIEQLYPLKEIYYKK